jgi:hypothetical protein
MCYNRQLRTTRDNSPKCSIQFYFALRTMAFHYKCTIYVDSTKYIEECITFLKVCSLAKWTRQAGRLDSSYVFPLQWFLTWNYAPVILWRERWRRKCLLRMNNLPLLTHVRSYKFTSHSAFRLHKYHSSSEAQQVQTYTKCFIEGDAGGEIVSAIMTGKFIWLCA